MTIHDKYMLNAHTCEYCGSFNLGINNQGFVICKTCGLEQDFDNIEEYNAIDENGASKDHNVFSSINRTYIGDRSERRVNETFRKLEKYQKNNALVYENAVYRKAYQDIRSICSRLQLSIEFAAETFKIFKRIWRRLTPRTKERSIEGLVPVVVYRTAQMLEFPIMINEIIAVSECEIKKFNSILFSTINKFPIINKRKEVLKRISITSEEMGLPEPVLSRSIKILESNKSVLLSTTALNGAGTSIALAVLSLGLRKKYRIYKIAEASGTTASSITCRISKVLKSHNIKVDEKIVSFDKFLMNKPESILS